MSMKNYYAKGVNERSKVHGFSDIRRKKM